MATERIPILENHSSLENIEITVNNKPIRNIVYHEYKIINKGLDVIKNIQLELSIPEDIIILEYKFDDKIIKHENSNNKYLKDNKFTIPIEFLNSFKHKEFCIIKIWANSSLEKLKFQGRGEGWKINYLDNTSGELTKTITNNKILEYLMIFLLPGSFKTLFLYSKIEKH
jgi:hypothetical protein